MNVFLASWNMAKETVPLALTCLRRLTEIYPQLDANTLWHRTFAGKVFAASVHTAPSAAHPRSYVAIGEDYTIFYDGVVVSNPPGFNAHRAEELALHWDRLHETLEGSFVLVRVGSVRPYLELMTDPLGIEQVYCTRRQEAWFLSNSVHLLTQIGQASALDPLGISMFLTLGWVGADRTLRRDVTVLPGGQRMVWQEGRDAPSVRPYFRKATVARRVRFPARNRRAQTEELARQFVHLARHLSHHFGVIRCPLTAGKDSRLLAAIMIKSGVPTEYRTSGDPTSTDVLIARQLAEAFGLPHTLSAGRGPQQDMGRPEEGILEDWDTLALRLVRQNDGLVSLLHMPDVMNQLSTVRHLPMTLDGVGGEIARSFYGCPSELLRRFSAKSMVCHFTRRVVKEHTELVRPDAVALARAAVRDFLVECLDEGIAPLDLPDVFYGWERVRRWGGSSVRETVPTSDCFRFLCTRLFIEAAFSFSARERYGEPLHYNLTRHLSPALHRLPYEHPWRSQLVAVNCAHALLWLWWNRLPGYRLRKRCAHLLERLQRPRAANVGRGAIFNYAGWLESKREWMRNLCLGRRGSVLWDFISRSALERLLSATTDPNERANSYILLYTIATLFCYEAA